MPATSELHRLDEHPSGFLRRAGLGAFVGCLLPPFVRDRDVSKKKTRLRGRGSGLFSEIGGFGGTLEKEFARTLRPQRLKERGQVGACFIRRQQLFSTILAVAERVELSMTASKAVGLPLHQGAEESGVSVCFMTGNKEKPVATPLAWNHAPRRVRVGGMAGRSQRKSGRLRNKLTGGRGRQAKAHHVCCAFRPNYQRYQERRFLGNQ